MSKIHAASWMLLLASLTPMVSTADSWMPATTTVTTSADGEWRITVVPREISSQLAYFQDKVKNKANAGAPASENRTRASARMEHRIKGKWKIVWETSLVNEVSPVDVLAAPGGAAATFDNWHSMGYGDAVVVIYNATGHPVRAFGLKDFLPKEFIQALPRSVSSMDWRGEPRLSRDGRELTIPVVVPTPQKADENYRAQPERYIDVRFDMATGRQIAETGPAWTDAVASANSRKAQLDQQEAFRKSRFIAPLSAPESTQERDWYDYLTEAFFRLDPKWKDVYPSTQVIRLPGVKDAKKSTIWLRQKLAEGDQGESVIMIASPSQDVLVGVLESEAARLKPGTLAKARIYVVADQAHAQRVRAALSHAGGTLILIDPSDPIAQRKERLDRYLKREAE